MNIDNIISYFADPYFNGTVVTEPTASVMLLIGVVIAAIIPSIFVAIALHGGKYAGVAGGAAFVSFFACMFAGIVVASYPMRWNAQFEECQDVEVKVIYKDVPIVAYAVECKSRTSIGGVWSDYKLNGVKNSTIQR